MQFIFISILIIISSVIYFFPSILAYNWGLKLSRPILILNIFLGWTFLFWALALVWVVYEDVNKKYK